MEETQNLYWSGQYDQKKKKEGKWIASWEGEVFIKVGGYYKKGLKLGLWNELFEDHFTQPQIFYTGEYLNDFKIGKWKYFYKNKIIDGGIYDNEGKKIGKWIELDKVFYWISYIIYTSSNGEYNKKGMKVGKWDILFNNYGNQQMQILKYSKMWVLAVVDNMIKKEARKRLESGQTWMKGLQDTNKSHIMENII
ncbi:unnamed protein product [Paramecium sonneborni]|uniref:MORN repeat protein n=1 Tax=Paramecium sonneborni TaxID=65129 RepID=A0A8S1RP96_9CILI|nr:unnamed protein product [Paramecium sonneborni]